MKKRRRAFTLVELMTVVAILALLASGSHVLYGRFVAKSRRILARRESFLAERALELHRRFEGRAARDPSELVRKGYLRFHAHTDEDRWLASLEARTDRNGELEAMRFRPALPPKGVTR